MSAPTQLLLDLVSPLPPLDDHQLRQWANGKTVMISSTMRDLGTEREAVAQVVAEFGAQARYFERFSSPGDPAQVYHPEVARADIYLFIAGQRYGDPTPGDPRRRSATHLEYDTAYEHFKPVLAYNKQGIEREPQMTELVTTLENRHTVTRFHGQEELKAAVREGLRRLAEAQSTTWVKLGHVVFPIKTIGFGATQGTSWSGDRQSQSITITASLRDPRVTAAIGGAHHSVPMTLERQIFDVSEVRLEENRAGRYDVTQTITLSARPAQTDALTIIPVSNGQSGEEQLTAALDSLLFGRQPAPDRAGGHMFSRALQHVAPRLAALHHQLAAHHRDAELFIPMAELLLTDRLLRGTQRDPAPLTQLIQLDVSPVVNQRLFVRVRGVHTPTHFGSELPASIEGVIDLRGATPTGIDSW